MHQIFHSSSPPWNSTTPDSSGGLDAELAPNAGAAQDPWFLLAQSQSPHRPPCPPPILPSPLPVLELPVDLRAWAWQPVRSGVAASFLSRRAMEDDWDVSGHRFRAAATQVAKGKEVTHGVSGGDGSARDAGSSGLASGIAEVTRSGKHVCATWLIEVLDVIYLTSSRCQYWPCRHNYRKRKFNLILLFFWSKLVFISLQSQKQSHLLVEFWTCNVQTSWHRTHRWRFC
jgi:hypothetical protein